MNLTAEEVTALYDCVSEVMKASYKGGGHWAVNKWTGFTNVTTHAYPSATHGNRFVVNYVNAIGKDAYSQYADEAKMPIGTTTAKPSFVVNASGQASLGPLFIMEKMTNGFNKDTANWRYAAILPGGGTMGITGGQNSAAMGFCHTCHEGAEDADFMFYLPEEHRAN